MKKLFKFLILIFLTHSCKDDVMIDNYILAGQKNGPGIEYTKLEPEIDCTILEPWRNTKAIIHLDLNGDSIDDFSINGSMCDLSMLGGDCESWTITPLFDNEIFVNPKTSWLDTIPYLDTIRFNNGWSHEKSTIYSYSNDISGYSSSSGNWKSVLEKDKYYIGIVINKDEKQYYGWIGMRSENKTNPCSFLISDFSILKDYSK